MKRAHSPITTLGRVKRYMIVRLFSRGGDYLISTTLITLWGERWFFPAVALSSLYNVSVDYLGQKLWAFDQLRTKKRPAKKEVVLYLLLRGLYAIPGFAILFLLYKVLNVPYAISALMVTTALWFISFEVFAGLFTGSPRDLPKVFRRSRITFYSIRKRVRTR